MFEQMKSMYISEWHIHTENHQKLHTHTPCSESRKREHPTDNIIGK